MHFRTIYTIIIIVIIIITIIIVMIILTTTIIIIIILIYIASRYKALYRFTVMKVELEIIT